MKKKRVGEIFNFFDERSAVGRQFGLWFAVCSLQFADCGLDLRARRLWYVEPAVTVPKDNVILGSIH